MCKYIYIDMYITFINWWTNPWWRWFGQKLGESHRVLGKHQKWITAGKKLCHPSHQLTSSSAHEFISASTPPRPPPQPASSSPSSSSPSSSSSFEQSSFSWSFWFFSVAVAFFPDGFAGLGSLQEKQNTGRPYEGLRKLGGQILTKANHI